jgi:hypothetical protein
MRAAQLAQWLRLTTTLIGVLYFGYYYYLLHRILLGKAVSAEEMNRGDLVYRFLSGVEFVMALLALLAFVLWFYRAYQNVHRLPWTKPQHKESMAGWSWFIPVLNVFYPYQMMKEIGHYFSRFTNSALSHTPRWKYLLLSWCGLNLAVYIMGRIVTAASRKPVETLAELDSYATVILLDEGITILSALVTLAMLKTIMPIEQDVAATHAARTT